MIREIAPAFVALPRRRRRAHRKLALRACGAVAVLLIIAAWDPLSWFGPTVPDSLTMADVAAFETRKFARLHRYRDAFENAAERHGVAWRLLAAIAYQESQWQPQAVSRTGVRGLMMLTRVTARDMGVSDRLDPLQSIDGGAKYMKWLLERIPGDAGSETQTALAVASYYAGLNRVRPAWLASGSRHWRDFVKYLRSRDEHACAERQTSGCELLLASLDYVHRVQAFHGLL